MFKYTVVKENIYFLVIN